MKKDKGILIALLIGCLLFVLLVFLFMAYFIGSSVNPKKEMTENFRLKENRFADLKAYFHSVDPQQKAFQIELHKHADTGVFSMTLNGQFIEKAYSDKLTFKSPDSLIEQTPWTNNQLLVLDRKLKDIGCKSVESSPLFKVGQIINGQAYYYCFFDYPLKKEYLEYNDTCKYVIYNERVVFEYEKKGDFDTDCFSR